MNTQEEEKLEQVKDFMSKISFYFINHITEKRSYCTDSVVLDDLLEKLKYNISLCPEAALEAQFYERSD